MAAEATRDATPVAPPAWPVNWATIWDRVAEAIPGAIAIETNGAELAYAELEDRAARLAGALEARGVRRGDTVGLFMYNRAEYLEGIYAAFKLGAVPVNMNFRYRARELAELLRISRSRALIAPSSLRTEVLGAFALLESPPWLIEVRDDAAEPTEAASEYESVLGGRLADAPELTGAEPIYMFTGGTTGTPKAVVWRHGDLLDAQLVSMYGTAGVEMPTSLDDIIAIAADPAIPAPRMLPIAPLMHSSALFNTMNALTLGGTAIFLNNPRFDPAQVLRTIQERRVTRTVLAGNAVSAPLVEELRRAAEAGEPYDLSSLDLLISSGMAWTDDSKAELLEHLDDALLFDVFGATEGGPFAYSFVRSKDDLPARIVLANGAAVLDEDGRELDLESGGTGILAYAGPKPIGYLDAPEKTAETYRRIGDKVYVMPGDWVRLLGERRVEFLGRGSNVVNTGGEKVYPAEVEHEILEHPDADDAVVFGVPDPRWGQAVAAVVARHAGSTLDADGLRAFLADRLAGYKKPRHVVVVDSLERSPSGKVDLARMRGLVEQAAR